MEILMLLQRDEIMTGSLLELVSIPVLSGSDGLDTYLSQFEAAIDSEFPNYQVSFTDLLT